MVELPSGNIRIFTSWGHMKVATLSPSSKVHPIKIHIKVATLSHLPCFLKSKSIKKFSLDYVLSSEKLPHSVHLPCFCKSKTIVQFSLD
jgi:hypothetical protein